VFVLKKTSPGHVKTTPQVCQSEKELLSNWFKPTEKL
jgi:hypothetical protein